MIHSDAGFFAKHIEKLILAAGLLILAIVAFLYLVASPYQVEIRPVVGPKVKAGPMTVENHVDDAVDRLEGKLSSGTPDFDMPSIPRYRDEFARTYQQNVRMAAGPILGDSWPDVGPTVNDDQNKWILPSVPMPLSVTAEADYGLMRFSEVFNPDVAQGLKDLIGPVEPADFRYVSVSATFDMDEWNQRFAEIRLENRVPDLIYRNSLFLTGVYLKRRTLNPVTKRWENEIDIQPLPDQAGFFTWEQQAFDRNAGEQAVTLVKTTQPDIARVPFPPVDQNRPWRPPGAAGGRLDIEQRQLLNKTISDIEKTQKQVGRLRKQLRLPEENRQAPPGVPDRFDDPGAVLSPPRGPSRLERPTRPERTGNNNREANLQARLTALEARLIELEQQRDAILRSRDPEAIPLAPDPSQPFSPENYPPEVLERLTPQQRRQLIFGGQIEADEAGLTQDNRIEVWAHDLSVEPGQTYQYKLVVNVLNPLFQNRQLHKDQVEENKNRIALGPTTNEINMSEWSSPVTVEPRHHFFVVSGNTNNQVAEVEIYSIFGGARQVDNFNVSPGDPIGGVVERRLQDGQAHNIDMRVGAFVVDIVSTPGAIGGISSARMLYLDPQTNRITTRDVSKDKNSRQLQDLRFEVNEAKQAKAGDRER